MASLAKNSNSNNKTLTTKDAAKDHGSIKGDVTSAGLTGGEYETCSLILEGNKKANVSILGITVIFYYVGLFMQARLVNSPQLISQ